MVLKAALEHRKISPLAPYKAEAWGELLHHYDLRTKYPDIFLPLYGKDSTLVFVKFTTPLPLPTVPLYLRILKLTKRSLTESFAPGVISNLCLEMKWSHSLVSSNHPRFLWFPSPENRTISELYTIFSFPISHLVHWSHYWSRRIPLHLGHLCFTIYNLPPGSQASIRDVAEVYRTIPSPQVNGLDLLSCGSEEILYCINTNSNFGLASAGGIYGKLVTLVQIFSALTESLLYRNGSTTTFSFEFYSSILALTTFGVLPSMISQKVVVRSLEATFGIAEKSCPTAFQPSSTKMPQYSKNDIELLNTGQYKSISEPIKVWNKPIIGLPRFMTYNVWTTPTLLLRQFCVHSTKQQHLGNIIRSRIFPRLSALQSYSSLWMIENIPPFTITISFVEEW